MLQQGSSLKVIDNSSVGEISCIRILSGGPRPSGKCGDQVLASVKSIRRVKAAVLRSKKHLAPKGKTKDLRRGDLVKALIVRSRKSIDRAQGIGRKAKKQTGIRLAFPGENAALILAANGRDPVGTRMKGPQAPSTRTKGYGKLLSLGGSLL